MIKAHLNIPPFSGLCFINVITGELPEEAIEILDVMLSDYVQNYERTTKYQEEKWDGKFRLFRKAKSGAWFFPVGYLEDVINVLEIYDVDVKPPNYEKRFPFKKPLGIQWKSPLTLREYQKNIVLNLLERNTPATIEIPTGSGKTLIALYYAHCRDQRFLVLVHRKELLYQWKDEIQQTLGITPTLVGDGHQDFSGKVVVAMVQTLFNQIQKMKELEFPLIIFDEVHTVPAHQAYRVAMKLGARWRLGLSATARRTDGLDKMIAAAAGPVCFKLTVKELVKQGYLAKPVFLLYRTERPDMPMEYNDKYSFVYKYGIVYHEKRNQLITKLAHTGLSKRRKIFINVKRIAHGKLLEGMIPNALFLHGKSENRTEILEDFKIGKIRCLISTLIQEGVNIPDADMYINAAAGQSFISTIQSAGRTLRTAPKKENTILVDFSDSGHRFLINDTKERFAAYAEVYEDYFYTANVLENTDEEITSLKQK